MINGCHGYQPALDVKGEGRACRSGQTQRRLEFVGYNRKELEVVFLSLCFSWRFGVWIAPFIVSTMTFGFSSDIRNPQLKCCDVLIKMRPSRWGGHLSSVDSKPVFKESNHC